MNTKSKFSVDKVKAFREKVGKSIRALREGQGLSQDQLAEIMQVHRSTISKVETGKFAITIDYLVKFAWYLNFEIELVKH